MKIRKSFLKHLIGGVSLTTTMFIFQACYGTPNTEIEPDAFIHGIVTSEKGEALPGIRVSSPSSNQWDITDENGEYKLFTIKNSCYNLTFQDTTEVNAQYEDKFEKVCSQESKIKFDIALNEIN